MHHLRHKIKAHKDKHDHLLVPRLDNSESGHLTRLESFANYVARQIGFKDGSECPELSKLAYEYLKQGKVCEEKIYDYFISEADADLLYAKLVEEFDRCVLSYFAYHWSQASNMITQVLSVDSEQKKLKSMVMAATRKKRFEKVTQDLKVTRAISLLVDEMKAIGSSKGRDDSAELMVPVAHDERSPVLLFMGGGMGAGKSTVLKDLLNDSFWSGAGTNAVVVEADAFKERDVIYRAISSRGHHQDMLQTAELVHQTSTDAASSVLVTALNEGRDVIMDGTFSWVPFVQQTIDMARNVHKHRYRMGVGYKVQDDGTVIEKYWEQIDENEEGYEKLGKRRPYRIELVGVVCDAYLAVVRGVRRAVATGRAVRVNSQLKSHKRFANAFPNYCPLVDHARLYCTNGVGCPPTLIGYKDGTSKLLVDPDEIRCLKMVSKLNDEAESIEELYAAEAGEELIVGTGSQVWKDIVLLPDRPKIQQELIVAIRKIETSAASSS